MIAQQTVRADDFIVAVRTTGIYCLPSCRPARRAKPENTTTYASPEEARAAGFRPCKLCRPDDVHEGRFPDESLIEKLVAGAMVDPGAFRDVGALADTGGVSASKLHELFRLHYHTTPADFLARARVAAARNALLEGRQSVSTIAYDVGFESLSAFQDNFRKYTAMNPLQYRRLGEDRAWTLSLPPDYPAERMLSYLGRDSSSPTERVEGSTYTAAIRLHDPRVAEHAAVVQVAIKASEALCTVVTPSRLPACTMARLHGHIHRTLGLAVDPTRFEAQGMGSPEVAKLIEGQRGLRLPLIADPFDGLVWAITGQQITLGYAFTMRRRLIERVGQEVGHGLIAPSAPEAVASLELHDLTAMGYSRSKASYIVGAARAVVDGRLPLGALAAASATRIERMLRGVYGIGPWSAQYLLMRSFGFTDCVPVGDAALTASLQHFFGLDARPGRDETLALMSRFSPYRSVATFHLWRRLQTARHQPRENAG